MRLNQAQIAAELNVGPESVCLWETGRRRIELDKLPRLAAALQLNAADLCRLALFERHPSLYGALFGFEMPRTPRATGADSAARFRAPMPDGGDGLEAGVVVCDSLNEREQLS